VEADSKNSGCAPEELKIEAPVWRGGFMSSNGSKIEKVQTHFQSLSSVASSLNTASDELTKVVATLDESLKKLNVGLTAWVKFRDRSEAPDDPNDYDEDQIGYCKVKGTWGIALRHVWGNPPWDERHGEEGPWLFNEAPRDMRLQGVDKIPELIEALNKEASETAKKVQAKTEEVRALANVIEQVASATATGLTQPPSDLLPYARRSSAPPAPPPYVKAPDPTPKPAPPPPYVRVPSKDKEGVK
jgi:prefoldin subunit 5